MKEKQTQIKAVLDYLTEHDEGITSWDAITMFGATRLSDIIFRLKKQGLHIVSEDEVVTTRFGSKTTISRYRLVD